MKSGKLSIFSMNDLLASPRLRPIVERLHPASVLATVKGVYEDVSREMLSAASERRVPDLAELTEKIIARLQDVERKENRLVIDASGILFPTPHYLYQLGSSVVNDMHWRLDLSYLGAEYSTQEPAEKHSFSSDPVTQAQIDILEAAPSFVAKQLCARTGAEDALFFASPELAEIAVFQTFGKNGAILTARRDLTEDAAGRRISDRMAFSQGTVVEIGSSNTVHFNDYLTAATTIPRLAMIYLAAEMAFAHEVTITPEQLYQLRDIAHASNAPILFKVDYAPLVDLSDLFLDPVPTVTQRLAFGADLLLINASQLIGGPGVGILLGTKSFLDRIRRSNTADIFLPHRVDMSGLARTLELYKNEQNAEMGIPILRLLRSVKENLQNRAERLIPLLRACKAVSSAEICNGYAYLTPSSTYARIPSVEIHIRSEHFTPPDFCKALENSQPSLVASQEKNEVVLNLKTVRPEYDSLIVQIFESFA